MVSIGGTVPVPGSKSSIITVIFGMELKKKFPFLQELEQQFQNPSGTDISSILEWNSFPETAVPATPVPPT